MVYAQLSSHDITVIDLLQRSHLCLYSWYTKVWHSFVIAFYIDYMIANGYDIDVVNLLNAIVDQ